MFDLNIEIPSNKDYNITIMDTQRPPVYSAKTHSATSSSTTIINSNGDESSSNTASTFIFDIMKKDDHSNVMNGATLDGQQSKEPCQSGHQWLKLSSVGAGETKQKPKRSRRGPRSRSSEYRGVTFYRRTGRWESHIWDCGKQIYLGGFDTAHAAARAYDLAAIKFRGLDADINFNTSDYEEDIKQVKNLSKEEIVHILRRHSNGFSRASSRYRGVALHKCGRWEAQMGQFLGKKAYDKAAIQYNGREAATNFEHSIDGDYNRSTNHNLDLNLGLSAPSTIYKENKTMGYDLIQLFNLQHLQAQFSVYDPYLSDNTANLVYGQLSFYTNLLTMNVKFNVLASIWMKISDSTQMWVAANIMA